MIKTCKKCGKKFNACGRAKNCQTCIEKTKMSSVPRATFLTIPDAPNYEINGKFVVRNKKTGRLLRPAVRIGTTKTYYWLPSNATPSGYIKRTAIALRRQAVLAVLNESFEPIPSVCGKYEIDTSGNVRNVRTKKAIKPNIKGVYTLWDDAGKPMYRSRNSLLWEVHGKIKVGCVRVEVRAEYQNKRYKFASCAECARFLLGKLHYSLNTLQCYLWARKSSFAGWNFSYFSSLPVDIKRHNDGLGKQARRQKKLEASS